LASSTVRSGDLEAVAATFAERELQDGEHFPTENIADLFEMGVVAAPLPAALGGSGWDLLECVQAAEIIASHSPSTALLLSMPLGLAGIYGLGEDIAPSQHRARWRSQTERIADDYAAHRFYAACNSERGAGGALEATQTTARRDASGVFVMNGEKILASGGTRADMFLSSAKVSEDDLPGSGVVEFFLVPADSPGVEIADDWDGFGMRATESQTVRYRDARADDLLAFPNFLELVSPTTYWYCIFAAITLGSASGMLRLLSAGGTGSPALRLRFAEAGMRCEALRAYINETARDWHPGAAAEYTSRVIRMKTHVTAEATKLCAELYALGGGRHYRRTDPAARLLADSFAGTALRPPLGATLDLLADQFAEE
jgi:alkylation response protein AidB-like acyl-CoA dehydrogenase